MNYKKCMNDLLNYYYVQGEVEDLDELIFIAA